MSSNETDKPEITCHMEVSKYNRWKEMQKYTYPYIPNNKTHPFVQYCHSWAAIPKKQNASECPLMIQPDCVLLAPYNHSMECPFSPKGGTREECECLGLNNGTQTLNATFSCTCMHDFRKDLASNAYDPYDIRRCDYNYMIRKTCKVTELKERNKFNFLCTLQNCHYKFEEEYFERKHNSTLCPEMERDYKIAINKSIEKPTTKKSHVPTIVKTTVTPINPKDSTAKIEPTSSLRSGYESSEYSISRIDQTRHMPIEHTTGKNVHHNAMHQLLAQSSAHMIQGSLFYIVICITLLHLFTIFHVRTMKKKNRLY